MTQDFLEYPTLVEAAMRGVVKSALAIAADRGLPGLHHFYITFRTRDPGVGIADRLLAQYPEEMTIVIEHQYWDLDVGDDEFSVTLSFGNAHENLIVPYTAITSFVDPSVKFGLQFSAAEGRQAPAPAAETGPADAPAESADAERSATAGETGGEAEVVALDKFRKK
jgi:hypothetical protein